MTKDEDSRTEKVTGKTLPWSELLGPTIFYSHTSSGTVVKYDGDLAGTSVSVPRGSPDDL